MSAALPDDGEHAMPDAADWFAEVRAWGVSAVATRLGLALPRPRSVAPCPSCGAEQRGAGDRRGPIGVRRDDAGWECHRCKAEGDGLTLAAWVVCGKPRPSAEGWRAVRERLLGASPLPPPRARPAAPPPPQRPPSEEVLPFWGRCLSVMEDTHVAVQLAARSLAPELIAGRDLARALPPRGRLPRWAFGGGASWRARHRVIVPLFGPSGALESLHARDLAVDARRPKGLSPGGLEVRGLVFADANGRALLRGASAAEATVILAEGVPDFLTWATRSHETGGAPAVLGILPGSWTDEVAARIPDGARVLVRTHDDAAGEGYADKIVATLVGRCRVFRPRKERADGEATGR